MLPKLLKPESARIIINYEFKYLRHMINNEFSDNDVKREIRNLFMRTNFISKRYSK